MWTFLLVLLFLYVLFNQELYFQLRTCALWLKSTIISMYRYFYPSLTATATVPVPVPPPTSDPSPVTTTTTTTEKKTKRSRTKPSEDVQNALKNAHQIHSLSAQELNRVIQDKQIALHQNLFNEHTKFKLGQVQKWSCHRCAGLLIHQVYFDLRDTPPKSESGVLPTEKDLILVCGKCEPIYFSKT